MVVLENVRVNKGEKKNNPELAKKYAALCDVFVMDAFGTAHRAEGSTYGVAEFAPVACAGPLLAAELDALGKALKEPQRPMLAIVGGSKVSTKLTVLDSLSKIADQLIVGGGIANTFIAAEGNNVGKSLYEADLIPEAQRLSKATNIPVPVDVRVGTEFSETGTARSVYLNSLISVKVPKWLHKPSLTPLQTAHSLLLVAAIRWRQLICSALLIKCPIFQQAAVRF